MLLPLQYSTYPYRAPQTCKMIIIGYKKATNNCIIDKCLASKPLVRLIHMEFS